MHYFAYNHPQAYRRLLLVGLMTVLTAGLLSLASPSSSAADAKPNPFTQLPRLGSVNLSSASASPKVASASAPVTALPPYGGPVDPADALAMAKAEVTARFGAQHWPALYSLWTRESGWNANARNSHSGACGIPQALPCSKISDHTSWGQVEWGLDYIATRYGNPTNAWRHWQLFGWY